MKNKCYTELIALPTFKERYEYLKLDGAVGAETFGSDRQLNQDFYRSAEWKRIRDYIIVRDQGCDLGMPGFEIGGKIFIHHMNPIEAKDILQHSQKLINPEYLICVSKRTHDAIHYSSEEILFTGYDIRRPNDTCPWK